MTTVATGDTELVEVLRAEMVESVHRGHVVICGADGGIVQAWGDPAVTIYPRSSCKMLQALPLLESGAADASGLHETQLALACASHQGAAVHTRAVGDWLSQLGLTDADLRCGPEIPRNRAAEVEMIRAGDQPCQIHNNCSGKHAGFLTLTRHLGAGPEYVDPGHPVQRACRAAFEEVTHETSPCFGIDGCSAPNFATSLAGLGRAMAFFATAQDRGDARSRAAARLVAAMTAHPALIAGEGAACTELMRAADGKAVIKTGAEGVYIAILPERRIGVALKITDGTTRASEAAIAATLVRLGVLDPAHPAVALRLNPPIVSRRGVAVGRIRLVAALAA